MKTLVTILLCLSIIIAATAMCSSTAPVRPQTVVKDTSSSLTPKDTSPTKAVPVYQVRIVDDKFDYNLFISMVVTVISVLALILPLRANRVANRRQTFFQFYDRWNSEKVLGCREGFRAMLEDHKDGETGKVPLLALSMSDPDEYNRYETLYDILYDIAHLYDQNLIDRKLVNVHLGTFIHSYTNALNTRFSWHDSEDDYLIKMSTNYYCPVINKLEQRIPKLQNLYE